MEIPFIKVKQKSEVFYICKMNALDLKKYTDFEFRDPYYEYKNDKDRAKDYKYISSFHKKGIFINSKEKSSQRKLQPEKVSSIKRFIEENEINFFPNSILLSLNIREDENDPNIAILEEQEIGTINIDEKYRFNVIDGQHRLAGIFESDSKLIDEFEIPVVLLIDVSVSYATKIFLDINENQTSVNKSLVYDLYESIEDESVYDIRKIHAVCQKFYKSKKSPLYKQIKMLGVGSGAISQAFFIDSVIDSLKQTHLFDKTTQDIYTELFNYFRAYQRTFQEDWPVILVENKNEELYKDHTEESYADKVLKINKSQLVKTTGFGGIMMAFPDIYKIKCQNNISYIDLIVNLKGKINWRESYGTGKSAQKEISKKILATLSICK